MVDSILRAGAARLRAWLGLVCAGLLGACGGGGDGGGGTSTVGPALNFDPLSNVTCADGLVIQINASFPQPFTFQGANSCLLVTFSAGSVAGLPATQPSGPGTVTSASVRVGPVSGPMRFVRMRILFQNGFGAACCSLEQVGAVFTPQPNATTTVPLNFPITFERAPPPTDTTTIIAQDLIALEVLAPNVPIPGVWTANGAPVTGLSSELWLPALSTQVNVPSNNLRSTGSFSGFLPSYNFTFAAR